MSREIRWGRLSRDEADSAELIQRYESIQPKDTAYFRVDKDERR